MLAVLCALPVVDVGICQEFLGLLRPIGEREGINGPSLKLLAESAGAQVVFSVTQCFV